MKKEFGSATVYTGKDAKNLTRKKRKRISLEVSNALKKHPHRMRQLTVNELHRSIMNENAVIVFSKGTKRLVAFSHVIPAKNEYGELEHNTVEVGALITVAEQGRGHAKRAVIEGVRLGRRQGNKRIKTLAHKDNAAANAVMTSLADEPYHSRASNYVKEADGSPAQMNVYDLTEVGREQI